MVSTSSNKCLVQNEEMHGLRTCHLELYTVPAARFTELNFHLQSAFDLGPCHDKRETAGSGIQRAE